MGPSTSWKGKVLKRRYRLDERIAVGGTTEVFSGYDLLEQIEVVIKLPIPHLLSDRDFCDNFRAAAVRAIRMHNPGIVEVFDYGIEEGCPFVVMEMIKEKSLNELLQKGNKMKPLGGMYFAIELSRILVYIHEQGVAHGSLDERHIYILPGKKAKLSDPGFPTLTAGATSPYPLSHDPNKDIRDLGYLLYRSLTGKSKAEAMDDIKEWKLEWDPQVPERFRRFVQLCLESTGHGGFASAEQTLREAITTLREDHPMLDVPTQSSDVEVTEEAHPLALPRLKRWQIITGIVVLLAAAIFFGIWALSTVIAPSKVQVPNFVNISLEDAMKLSGDNDLGLLVVGEIHDANVKTDYIISQSPEGGMMVHKKTVVRVLKSLGPLTVPNLVGLSLEDARTVLESRGFRAGEIIYREVPNYTPNYVVETDPPYGSKLSSGDVVNLVVSKNPP